MAASFEIKSRTKVYDGTLIRFSHLSSETKTTMTCSVYLPSVSEAEIPKKCATLMYLAGLTCSDENVCQKSGVFKTLSDLQMGLIAPDTCPRGAGVPGETDSWDFGQGAGFYLDATTELWKDNYRMYSYITKELPTVLTENFPTLDLSRMGITGHSMGGHGALTIGLKNPKLFRSVSAFAPICNPINGEWGKKAFTGYLGGDPKDLVQRKEYDACSLIASRAKECGFDDILVDQGTGDNFYKSGQLMPEALQKACEEAGQKVTIRFQEGFDHSYYFISTFIEDHVRFHAARLV